MPSYQAVKICHYVADGHAVTARPGDIIEISHDAAGLLGSRVKPAPKLKTATPPKESTTQSSDSTQKGQ